MLSTNNIKPVYLNIFENKEDVRREFELSKEYMKDINILFATYGYECYEGNAFVLYEKNGVIYETNGGHCSCYGLEGQWSEEDALLDELYHRATEGSFGYDRLSSAFSFGKELIRFLSDNFGYEYKEVKREEYMY